jgi:hypothetical protein
MYLLFTGDAQLPAWLLNSAGLAHVRDLPDENICRLAGMLHCRVCGRLVQPSAMDLMLLDSQQGSATAVQPESEACELWSCCFCDAECSSAEVEHSCRGSVELKLDQEPGAADTGSIHLQVSHL